MKVLEYGFQFLEIYFYISTCNIFQETKNHFCLFSLETLDLFWICYVKFAVFACSHVEWPFIEKNELGLFVWCTICCLQKPLYALLGHPTNLNYIR